MHRSRLVAALVDVPENAYKAEVSFWSGVTGITPAHDERHPAYADFGEPSPGFQFMVQRVVDDPARVHLDVEADDVEAEVARLERLGATRLEKVHAWWQMRDPAGLVFCVVPVQSPAVFARHARVWADLRAEARP